MTLPTVLVGDDLVVTLQGVVVGVVLQPIDFFGDEDGRFGDDSNDAMRCTIHGGIAGPICDEDWMFSNSALGHHVIHRLDEEFGVSDRVRHFWQAQERELYYEELPF